jgi:hypothetical protein
MATKKLGAFQRLWAEYASGPSEEVKARIGGAVNAAWIGNTCVVRVSRSLNYAGFPVPEGYPGLTTVKGGDGQRYGIRVTEFKAYLDREYGPPQVTHAYERQGGAVPAEIKGRQGIICFEVSGWSDASGHFDLWNGAACINHGYFERASRVHLWEVGDGDAPAAPAPGQALVPARAPVAAPRAITASVGAGGVNRPDDVRVVQALLAAKGVYAGAVDGIAGEETLEAITAFQKRFASAPDGRVDVNGRTLRELQGL